MKPIKFLFFLVPFLFFAFTINSFAKDTDIYEGNTSTVEPNLLIIFDTSVSMGDSPVKTYCDFDPTFAYPQPSGIPSVDPIKVYQKGTSSWFPNGVPSVYRNTVILVPCLNAQTVLKTYGQGLYTGKPDTQWCNSGTSRSIATGNWLRFNFADAGNKATCRSKLDVAKEVITGFLQDLQGIRVGLMVFNYSEGGHIVADIKGLDEDEDGLPGGNSHRQQLIADVNAITNTTYTTLAETLYEAGLYFKGAASYFNIPKQYTSPIQYYCQKNYVVIMTDGLSRQDCNSILDTVVGDRNGDKREPPRCINPLHPGVYDPGFPDNGSDYLDDVAKYLYDGDLIPDDPQKPNSKGKQNVVTYTIGYELDMDPNADDATSLLKRAANLGGGKFYSTSQGSAGLADAFSSVLNEVLAKTSSFVAPIVPVSRMEKTTAGDKIYLAFFKASQTGMWHGNIKKYGVAQADKSQELPLGIFSMPPIQRR